MWRNLPRIETETVTITGGLALAATILAETFPENALRSAICDQNATGRHPKHCKTLMCVDHPASQLVITT